MSTPQQVVDNPMKEEQHSKSTTTPAARTRLQKIREAVKTEIRNPNTENIRAIPIGALGNSMSGGVRGQPKTVAAHPHPERGKMIDLGTLRGPPHLATAIQPERLTRPEPSGARSSLERDDAQTRRTGEETENELWQEDVYGDRAHNSPANTPLHPATLTPMDSSELQCNYARTRSVGGGREMGSRGEDTRGENSQGDRDLFPPHPDKNRVRRSGIDDDGGGSGD